MKITSAKQLSNAVQDARKKSEQSQSEVAKKVGIRQDTVSKFELNPDGTKLETLFKVLAALNLELYVQQRGGESLSSELHSVNDTSGWNEEW